MAARDQVQLREWRILDDAVHREDARLANFLDRAIMVAVFREPPLEPLGRHARHHLPIASDACDSHGVLVDVGREDLRSEEHTSELQSLMRISYAVFCLKKKTT